MPVKTYTPSEIAGFCDVASSTVTNWIKEGSLQSYSTPGGHHRVPREGLIAFLREFKVPLPEELGTNARHVLIVDDEPAMLGMFDHALSLYKDLFTFECRPNGYGALLAIGQRKPALLVLDILMPELDGWGVIDYLKADAQTSDIKIIAMSGQKPRPTQEELAAHKVDAFFEKPFDAMAFLDKAAELVGVRLPTLRT